MGRLTREMRDVGNNNSLERDVSYSYDVDGNRDDEVDHLPGGETRHYVYEPNSHRLDKIEVAGTTVEDFAWTANGELASKTDSSGVTTYLWGPDGTLAEVQLPGGERVEYDYDHDGELIARKFLDDQGQTLAHSRYLVDHQNLTGYSQRVAEIDVLSGTVRVLNSFTDSISAQTRLESAGLGSQTLHADGLGSIRHLTGEDDSGSILDEAYDYKAFGSLIAGNRSLTDYAFTGQLADAASQLQYHRARWLSPSEGTWLSQDPYLDFPLNFGSAYSYAGSSPVSSSDLSGLFTLAEGLTVVAILLIVVMIAMITAFIPHLIWLRGTFLQTGQPQPVVDFNDSRLTVNANSIHIRVNSAVTTDALFDFLKDFEKSTRDNPAGVRATGIVTGINDEVSWDLPFSKEIGQADFRVRTTKYDEEKHLIVVVTLGGHPLSGWRFWRIDDLGNNELRIWTGAIDHPTGWYNSVQNNLPLIGDKKAVMELWEGQLENMKTFILDDIIGGAYEVIDDELSFQSGVAYEDFDRDLFERKKAEFREIIGE